MHRIGATRPWARRGRLALTAALTVAIALALGACGSSADQGAAPGAGGSPAKGRTTGGSATGTATAARGVPRFSHVVVVVFENKNYSDVIGNRSAPTFNRLARRYSLFSRYYGVAHPSLPNYLALVSGSTQNIHSDCTDCHANAPNLADSLDQKGLTWKTYAEGLPRVGFTGGSAGRYAKKHNPFVYFDDVTGNSGRLQRIVALPQFSSDLAAGALPSFSLVVPDLCHDAHDCPISTADRWLAGFLPGVLANRQMRSGVVFVVFDEADNDDTNGGGHTVAMAVGPTVRRGKRFAKTTSHYGLLRTIEDAWGLPKLGQSASAPPITGIWR